MKGLVNLIFCFLIVLLSKNVRGQKNIKHVVLISLDGSHPEFYMDSTWNAKNLQKLKNKGAFASKGAKSVFPSLTWPAHTSIVTGSNPGGHGVLYNKPFDGRPGQGYWYYSYIQNKTIFDAISESGMTSGAVWWPVLAAGPVNYNFPVRRPEKSENRFDKLSIREPYITPKGLLKEVESKIGREFTVKDLEFKKGAQGKLVTAISRHIIKEYKPNFLALHLGDIDHAQHAHGTNSQELREAVAFNDSLVGSIIDAIKEADIEDSTAIIVTGDHGHTNTKSILSPNTYLKKNGLISEYGWKAKFEAAGGSGFLYLKKSDDKHILDSVRNILKGSDEYQEGLFEILERSDLDKMGANKDASLAIATKEGVSVSNKHDGEAITLQDPPYKSTHGYDPEYESMHTAFLVVGPGIKHVDVKRIKLVDIAPFIGDLLGLDFNAPDGDSIKGVFGGNLNVNSKK